MRYAAQRHEWLCKNDKTLYQVSGKKGAFTFPVPAAGYSDERLQSILDVECSDGKGHQTTCFLKRIAQNYSGLNADLKKVFDAINHRLIAAKESGTSIPDGCYYRPLPGKNQLEVVDIRSFHNNMRGEPVEFNFLREESEGTQRVASLVGLILACLNGGHTLFVDELENSLHPLLLKELIRMFKDKRYNQSGAQIVFATHNTDILDNAILRLGEAAIVRKTTPAGTLVRRLVDFKEDGLDVRNVTNFRKQYLDGFYSGIPHPAI